jgi:hypothetical protein
MANPPTNRWAVPRGIGRIQCACHCLCIWCPELDEGRYCQGCGNHHILDSFQEHKAFCQFCRLITNHMLCVFLVHASHSDALKLNIIAYLAKASKLTKEEEHQPAELVASLIGYCLGLTLDCPNGSTNSKDHKDEDYKVKKQNVSSALALACLVRPWPVLLPFLLVEAAIPYDFWHASHNPN